MFGKIARVLSCLVGQGFPIHPHTHVDTHTHARTHTYVRYPGTRTQSFLLKDIGFVSAAMLGVATKGQQRL